MVITWTGTDIFFKKGQITYTDNVLNDLTLSLMMGYSLL